jgi:hypothetical protein
MKSNRTHNKIVLSDSLRLATHFRSTTKEYPPLLTCAVVLNVMLRNTQSCSEFIIIIFI